uniref:F-box protein At-B n=1 Tax=Anthurium amnicola TaxID=1678845 RepID=A0A1D1XLI0_9ARAE
MRLLMLEMLHRHDVESSNHCERNIAQMLEKCSYLEMLRIKFLGHYVNPDDLGLGTIRLKPPKTIKSLLLQPTSERHAKLLVQGSGAFRSSTRHVAELPIPFPPETVDFRLQSLSLVLNRITDGLLFSIVHNLHLLAELCLEDRPAEKPSLHHDLTNSGLQSLGSCSQLTRLSLTRSRLYCTVTFSRVNDMGLLLLAEDCRKLESIRLAGFSRVSDAGYASLLHSCKKLKRFEVVNSTFLSDLAFYNIDAPSSLVDVRLVSCSKLTSEAATSLASCRNLEVLDLSGCKSIDDCGLCSISTLGRLSVLNLGGADITDSGLSILGNSCSPITSLSLRNCKRVTDKGVASLLLGDGIIRTTLLTLDLGCLPGISDIAICTIAEACRRVEDLCIRYCYSITDASISVLGSIQEYRTERWPLRRLDLSYCNGLSADSIQLLCRPYFRGLRWLGIGSTTLSTRSNNGCVRINQDRPWINVCLNGCEIGCKDGWQFHGWV